MSRRATIAAVLIAAVAAPAQADTTDVSADIHSSARATAPPLPAGRLSDDVVPAGYRIDITMDPARPRFNGHVEIDATLKSQSRFIWMHGRDLAMHSVTAKVGSRVLAGEWRQVDETGVTLLTFAEPLPAGPVTFDFIYNAAFNEGPSGLFHVKVGDDWYSWSQFESIDARAAFPGFDQPTFKQPFTVTLRTPPHLLAISNSPEVSVTREGGLDVHRFAPTAPLPTYLLAMMAGPFAAIEGAVAPTPQRDHPLPLRVISTRQNAAHLAFALDNSKRIVALLEDYFGESFPYPKLDQITAPIMPGAMENAGADLYEDSLLVLDDTSATREKREFGMVVSHELAHQWFGDLVTPLWWDDIWLNESFANWMGFRIGDAWRGDLHIGAGALDEGFAAMNADSLLAGRPIHQPITRNTQIDAAFDSITYGKGGQVIAMIAAYMGDARFRDGVRRHMASHRYGGATSDDFFTALSEASADPRILPALRSFTDQQGVPLLTFAGGDGHYTVSQSRYAQLGTSAPATRWSVPMCLRRGEARTCQLLEGESLNIAIPGNGPLIPNAGGSGYYRFELPQNDWNALIEMAPALPAGEALALADSLRASFLAGRASASQLLRLGEVMASNLDSHAADSALPALRSFVNSGLMDADALVAFHGYLNRIYTPLLATYGIDLKLGAYSAENPERSQRRLQIATALAAIARDRELRGRLDMAAIAYLGGDNTALDPSWFDLAMPARIERGGLPAAQQLLARAVSSQDPLFRPSALDAVAGSGNPDIGRWLLEQLDRPGGLPDLRLSEKVRIIMRLTESLGTRKLGYAWVRHHIDELLKGGSGIFLAGQLPTMFSGFCADGDADRISHDFDRRFRGTAGELELARALERIRDCVRLKEARRDEVSAAMLAADRERGR